MQRVELAPINRSRDLTILAEWLKRPHIAKWWGDPETTIAELRRHPADTQAMIRTEERTVGYVCWQTLTQQERSDAGLDDLPPDLIDIDIMIGDPELLGRGAGPAALAKLFEKLQAGGVRHVGLATALANKRAFRAFTKAGFRPFREFRESGQTMVYLTRNLDDTRLLPLTAMDTGKNTLRSIGAVLVGYLVFGISAGLLFALSGQDPKQIPSIGFAVGSVAYGMFFAFAGGWVAAALAGRKEVLHALSVAGVIFCLAVVSFIVQIGKGSMWSELATIVLMAPAAVMGGIVRQRFMKYSPRDKDQ